MAKSKIADSIILRVGGGIMRVLRDPDYYNGGNEQDGKNSEVNGSSGPGDVTSGRGNQDGVHQEDGDEVSQEADSEG